MINLVMLKMIMKDDDDHMKFHNQVKFTSVLNKNSVQESDHNTIDQISNDFSFFVQENNMDKMESVWKLDVLRA